MENSPAKSGLYDLAERVANVNIPKKGFAALFALFIILQGAVSCFHEPWLDEAQAWLIARDASFYDMLFVIPHYEGHPCIWTLLLSVPAKLGCPYEASLKAVMLIISAASVYLVMFKSPFKPIVRALLPFTYFFFYQYGIIARPYGLLMLGFILAAITYKKRNEKPFPYVLSLMLLCASSAFGIVLSGGLAAVWCFGILKEYGGFKGIFTKFIKTKRFGALCLLLIWAAGLIISVLSYDETFTNDTVKLIPLVFLRGLWYMFFMLPADAMLVGSGSGLGGVLKYNSFGLRDILTLSLPGGMLFFAVTALAYRKGKLQEFLLPMSLLAVFGSAVYFINHHIGIIVMFYCFIFWICIEERDVNPPVSKKFRGLENIGANIGTIANTAVCGIALAAGTVWSLAASVNDINNDYFYGKAAAEYIKENHFDELNIMSSWYYEPEISGNIIVSADKQHQAVNINPYFDENIFFNFNNGDRTKGYILHRLSEEANEEQYALWRETLPDILVGEPVTELVYDTPEGRRTNYFLIKTIPYTQGYKMGGAENYLCIYMRRDLFEKYPNIKPESPTDYEFVYNQQ
ncbi:MAG: hypothetical protein K2K57_14220 [Oscillospiraceae bacterium]|nr:hypothetical protein [Oscillospiraceae bacterium]